jgi:hypothetical protein
MRAVLSKTEIEADIATRFGDAFRVQEKSVVQTLSTGIAEVNLLTGGGLPRGSISEIFGPASSGRTSLMLSMLAYATTHDEVCALVDTDDVFTPTVAVAAGIDLDRLLWIRCNTNLEHAFKATDLLLHAGGFGLVILDLGDVPGKDARRVISSWWYRFRRTVENRPTALMVMSAEACTRSCASLTLEMNGAEEWQGTAQRTNALPLFEVATKTRKVAHANLLNVNSIKINRRRPLIPGLNECNFRVIADFRLPMAPLTNIPIGNRQSTIGKMN